MADGKLEWDSFWAKSEDLNIEQLLKLKILDYALFVLMATKKLVDLP